VKEKGKGRRRGRRKEEGKKKKKKNAARLRAPRRFTCAHAVTARRAGVTRFFTRALPCAFCRTFFTTICPGSAGWTVRLTWLQHFTSRTPFTVTYLKVYILRLLPGLRGSFLACSSCGYRPHHTRTLPLYLFWIHASSSSTVLRVHTFSAHLPVDVYCVRTFTYITRSRCWFLSRVGYVCWIACAPRRCALTHTHCTDWFSSTYRYFRYAIYHHILVCRCSIWCRADSLLLPLLIYVPHSRWHTTTLLVRFCFPLRALLRLKFWFVLVLFWFVTCPRCSVRCSIYPTRSLFVTLHLLLTSECCCYWYCCSDFLLLLLLLLIDFCYIIPILIVISYTFVGCCSGDGLFWSGQSRCYVVGPLRYIVIDIVILFGSVIVIACWLLWRIVDLLDCCLLVTLLPHTHYHWCIYPILYTTFTLHYWPLLSLLFVLTHIHCIVVVTLLLLLFGYIIHSFTLPTICCYDIVGFYIPFLIRYYVTHVLIHSTLLLLFIDRTLLFVVIHLLFCWITHWYIV